MTLLPVASLWAQVDEPLKLGAGTTPAPATTPAASAPAKPGDVPFAPVAVQSAFRPQRIVIEKTPGLSLVEAWKHHFAAFQSSEPAKLHKLAADIRETCRQLKYEKNYEELIAVINAALHAGYPQPWMYEALAIAMQLSGSPGEDVERALMSAVDFSTTPEDLMIVAAYLAGHGFDARALKLLRSVSAANPARAEPYIQGMSIAERLDDVDALQWASLGVISQAWPREHQDIEDRALRVAQTTLKRLYDDGRMQEMIAFRKRIDQARVRDIRVEVTWTGDADIDVLVEEPAGTVCSLHQPKTTSGGVLVGDTFSQPGDGVSGTTELYICAEGFNGHYRMLLRRVWGQVTTGKVTVDLYTNYGGPNQSHRHQQIELAEGGALLEWDLQDGRRQQSLGDEQLAVAAQNHLAISRAIIGQQLSLYENSQAVSDYAKATRKGHTDGWLGAGAVRSARPGYRPVITTLPSGSNMTATAVISADRRYVRVTPTPLFSQIGQVNTFNFSTGGSGTTMTGTMTMTMTMTRAMTAPAGRS